MINGLCGENEPHERFNGDKKQNNKQDTRDLEEYFFMPGIERMEHGVSLKTKDNLLWLAGNHTAYDRPCRKR
jgi:hypothetical protein